MKSVNTAVVLSLLFFAGGCFSFSSPRPVRAWFVAVQEEKVSRIGADAQVFKVTRLGDITVAAPFDKSSIAVLRADGTIAYDAYNVYASVPASLLRQPAKRLLTNDGRFGSVVHRTSIAAASAVVEVLVSDFSLDCREENKRKAKAEVELSVIKSEKGVRNIIASSVGQGSADAASGDYSESFTVAFTQAVKNALDNLQLKK